MPDDSEASATIKPLHTEEERREVVWNLYSPLQVPQPWETRLLALQPGMFNDPLITNLGVAVITYTDGLGLVDEHRNVEYEALSYTWGGEILSQPMVCNGQLIGITQNLSTALRYLRREDRIRYLWVDAICINQSDNEEKGRQIGNMRLIFKRANNVIAWLGEAGDFTEVALDALETLHASRLVEQHSIREKGGLTYHPELFSEVQAQLREDKSAEHLEKLERGLLDLALRPWQTRVWIIQEAVVAQRLDMQCGRRSVHWDVFASVVLAFESIGNLGANEVYGGQFSSNAGGEDASITRSLKVLDSIIEDFAGNERDYGWRRFSSNKSIVGRRELIRLISETTHLKATDPRDKIWALVGLANVPVVYRSSSESRPEDSIHIDYRKPVAQVYAEVTKYLFHRIENAFKWIEPGKRNNDLPSWSLDWRNMSLPAQNSSTPDEKRIRYKYRNLNHNSELYLQDVPWNVLKVSGWHIGTICALYSKQSEVDDSSKSTYADVLLTTCLKQGILHQVKGGLKWHDASVKFIQPCDREPLDTAEKTSQGFSGLLKYDKEYVPPNRITEYVNGKHEWDITGDPRPNDIIVHCDQYEGVIVLRKASDSTFIFAGNASPTTHLSLLQGVADEDDRMSRRGYFCHRYPTPTSEEVSGVLLWGTHREPLQTFDLC